MSVRRIVGSSYGNTHDDDVADAIDEIQEGFQFEVYCVSKVSSEWFGFLGEDVTDIYYRTI